MEAYFDNSATTRVLDSVKDIVVKTMTEDYGNAAAKHSKGMVAENYIKQARAEIAKTLKVAGQGDFIHLRRHGVQQYGSDGHGLRQ
ncbi:hypothetical protein HMPREF9473_03877 [ [Hungatella hathewayi WAL-18680]|uniref:Aminotransferase class V domain-containing protein n=1 Tax=Hungatella hathewayi WAL-18680 TaxID=742737 RepID=G5IK49_9FIRM|nr:hypothetical protein HMPREF9473_03877 [ [Hungatella hathewayi WAL-18680]